MDVGLYYLFLLFQWYLHAVTYGADWSSRMLRGPSFGIKVIGWNQNTKNQYRKKISKTQVQVISSIDAVWWTEIETNWCKSLLFMKSVLKFDCKWNFFLICMCKNEFTWICSIVFMTYLHWRTQNYLIVKLSKTLLFPLQ